MDHPLGNSLVLDVGEAAQHFLYCFRPGDGLALRQILSQKKGIYLGGVAPQRHVLIAVGKEGLRVVVEIPTRFLPRNIGPIRTRDVKITRNLLQPISFQLSCGHVVVLGQNPRIDDMPAKNFVLPVGDRALGNLHPRRMASK